MSDNVFDVKIYLEYNTFQTEQSKKWNWTKGNRYRGRASTHKAWLYQCDTTASPFPPPFPSDNYNEEIQ